jgi:hypothetical protein
MPVAINPTMANLTNSLNFGEMYNCFILLARTVAITIHNALTMPIEPNTIEKRGINAPNISETLIEEHNTSCS